MALEAGRLDFRPLRLDDLPLLHRWLRMPAVREWWGDEGSTLAKVEAHYAPCIAGAEPTRCFVVLYAGLPIGFVQTYRVADYPDHEAAIGAGPGTAGVDLFIGEEAYLHRGLGAPILRRFLATIVFAADDVTCCMIDPSVRNTSAIRAYEKAGFRHWRTTQVTDQSDLAYVMRLERASLGAVAGGVE